MQRFFRSVFIAAVAVSAACYSLIPVLLLLPNTPRSALIAGIAGLMLAPFLSVGLMLRAISDGKLCIPCAASAHKYGAWLVIFVFLVWFAVGILLWPAAPIQQAGNSFTDKRGRVYTRSSYDAFRKWEATLPLAWLPFALLAVASLPATDRKRHLHYCQ